MILKCEVCGNITIREVTVDEVFYVGGHYRLVEQIPATECTQCGERTFSRETAENVRNLLHGHNHPLRAINLDVFAYRPMVNTIKSTVIGLGI